MPTENIIQIGQSNANNESWTLTNAPTISDVPASMTFSKYIAGLVTETHITENEGESWVAGTLPSVITTFLLTKSNAEKFPTRARFLTEADVQRSGQLITDTMAAFTISSIDMDTFFRTYA